MEIDVSLTCQSSEHYLKSTGLTVLVFLFSLVR